MKETTYVGPQYRLCVCTYIKRSFWSSRFCVVDAYISRHTIRCERDRTKWVSFACECEWVCIINVYWIACMSMRVRACICSLVRAFVRRASVWVSIFAHCSQQNIHKHRIVFAYKYMHTANNTHTHTNAFTSFFTHFMQNGPLSRFAAIVFVSFCVLALLFRSVWHGDVRVIQKKTTHT